MKKTIVALSVAALLSGCKLVSLVNQEQITIIEGSHKLGASPVAMVNIDIDSVKNVPFLFDTGASRTYVSNLSLIPDNKNRKYVKFGKTLTPDGKKHPNKYTATKIKTPWFESKNKIIGLFKTNNAGPCPGQSSLNGLVGIDAFAKSDAVIEIFYSDSVINSHKRENYKVPAGKGFQNVNAVFEKSMIYIPITINGKSQLYLLDSGSNAGIITTYEKSLEENAQNSVTILGKSMKGIADDFGEETILFNGDAKLGNVDFKTTLMIQKTKYQINNFGLGAMHQFDWIIDFRDKQVYARKNSFSAVLPEIKKVYYSGIVNGNIQIISKIKGNSTYDVGNKIVSVKGDKVTAQNICKLQQLLATANDWSKLEVVAEK